MDTVARFIDQTPIETVRDYVFDVHPKGFDLRIKKVHEGILQEHIQELHRALASPLGFVWEYTILRELSGATYGIHKVSKTFGGWEEFPQEIKHSQFVTRNARLQERIRAGAATWRSE